MNTARPHAPTDAGLAAGMAAEALSDSHDLRQHVLDELRRVTGWELVFYTRVAGDDLEILETSGPSDWLAPGTVVPLEDTSCFRMLTGAAPPTTAHASSVLDPYYGTPACQSLGIESYSGHVVRSSDGHIFGTLCAIDHNSRDALPAHRRLGETFARLLAWELEREQMFRELSARASTDALTGLANRHVFFDQLRSQVGVARGQRCELALVVVDVDHFKQVNDAHGHPVGDRVLVEIAGRLAASTRSGDLLARIGGEEFAWILPGADDVAAWQAAERARQSIAAQPLSGGVRLTISAGVAGLGTCASAEELYRLADMALYWSKERGRNQCFRYTPAVAEALTAQERTDSLSRSQAIVALRALARALDARDPSTLRHSERVAELAVRLAGELGWDDDRRHALREAGLLHDVGKTGVPDAILFKPDRLTDREYERVKEHAMLGFQIVSDVLTPEQSSWVRGHHERSDGSGYPDGLSGAMIPDGAAILAIADAWDAMTSFRIYAGPRATADALAECRLQAGRQFDPVVVEALEALFHAGGLSQLEAISG